MSEFDGGFVCSYYNKTDECKEHDDCAGCAPYEFWAGRKPILDPCCGPKMFWFDKNNHHVLFCDNRTLEPTLLSNGATITVAPDILADVTALPIPDESFWHIVFDPPHSTRAGANGWMSKKYGSLGRDWQLFIRQAFTQLWRVLKPNGTLIFKWNEMHIPLSEILAEIPPEIAGCKLYGHRSGKQQLTHWIAFFKEP